MRSRSISTAAIPRCAAYRCRFRAASAHILEYLVKNAHRRVTKSQIFNAIYGIFDDNVDEIVVEGHISKLRKKLRLRLGRDVIDAKRYLGYQFVG